MVVLQLLVASLQILMADLHLTVALQILMAAYSSDIGFGWCCVILVDPFSLRTFYDPVI